MPWWQSTAMDSAEEIAMTYECDAKLGRPKEVDCAHVEWEELGADTDEMDLVPGAVRTLASGRFVCQHLLAGLTIGL